MQAAARLGALGASCSPSARPSKVGVLARGRQADHRKAVDEGQPARIAGSECDRLEAAGGKVEMAELAVCDPNDWCGRCDACLPGGKLCERNVATGIHRGGSVLKAKNLRAGDAAVPCQLAASPHSKIAGP